MKQKINLSLTLIALVAVLSAAFGITLVYYSLFQTQVKKDLALYTRLLADTGVFQTAYAGTEDVNAYVESAALVELKRDNPRITWISGSGIVLYDNGADVSGLANHLDRPEIQEAIETGSGEIVRRSDTFNLNTFYYALLLEDGTILQGANQENIAYPSGLCAERTVMFAAGANHPGVAFDTLAIVGGNGDEVCEMPAAPCGRCRHVMA